MKSITDYIGKFQQEKKIKLLGHASDFEQKRISELKMCSESVASTLRGQEAHDEWKQFQLLLSEEIASNDPRGFLSWKVIRKTMLMRDQGVAKKELGILKNDNEWGRISKAIENMNFGIPIALVKEKKFNTNMIHLASHLVNYKNTTIDEILEHDLIVEFGGGYGAMALILRKLGYRGRYVIMDFPIFNCLQKYYLSNNGVEIEGGDINLVSDFIDLQDYISASKRSMLIATWSFSETPIEFRNLNRLFFSGFDDYLIAYQDVFCGINNESFFAEFKEAVNRDWDEGSISYMKNNKYLIGKKV